MAKVTKRSWYSTSPTGQRQKRVAWGFTTQGADGRQIRRSDASWTREDAEHELAKHRLGIAPKNGGEAASLAFGVAVERYLKAKSRKRSIKNDERSLKLFTEYFGAETPLTQITAARISGWKAERLAATCPQTKRHYSAAAINRPLAALHHLLKLAHEEWELLPAVPKVRLEKEAQGRLRWLEPDEQTRLLAACRASRNPQLANIVTVALETGLRVSELLGLTWDRVDLSRGVIRLELTKSGRRREIPMRQVVYNVLASLPEPREGRVWRLRNIRTAFENAVEAAKIEPSLSRPASQLRVLVHDARRPAPDPQGDPRPRGPEDDSPVRAPGARAPAERNAQDRAAGREVGHFQHKISTERTRRGSK